MRRVSCMNIKITQLACVGLFYATTLVAPAEPPPPDAAPPPSATVSSSIQLLQDGEGRFFIKVASIPAAHLKTIRKQFDRIKWSEIFRVYVANSQTPTQPDKPLWGNYLLDDDGVRFLPRFPLRRSLTYRVEFDLTPLLSRGNLAYDDSMMEALVADLKLPAAPTPPRTTLTGIYPSAEVLPENLLKFYLEFSGPMSRGEAYEHITLLDGRGEAIELPFLELDEELWDPSATRLTLFIDPGRIKRGLKPHEEIGPSLLEGGEYQLVINPNWRDAHRKELVNPIRKHFSVGPPDYTPIDPNTWKISTPPAGTTTPLVVTFSQPLDYGLLQRVLQIEDQDGEPLEGSTRVDKNESQWSFTPAAEWKPGEWALVVDRVLEDLAGNSVGRAFDVEVVEITDRYDSRRRGRPVKLTFQIR